MYRDCVDDRRTLTRIRGLRTTYDFNRKNMRGQLPGAWPTIDEILDFGADQASTSGVELRLRAEHQ